MIRSCQVGDFQLGLFEGEVMISIFDNSNPKAVYATICKLAAFYASSYPDCVADPLSPVGTDRGKGDDRGGSPRREGD